MKKITILALLVTLFSCCDRKIPTPKFKVGNTVRFILDNNSEYIIDSVRCNRTCKYDLLDVNMKGSYHIKEELLVRFRKSDY